MYKIEYDIIFSDGRPVVKLKGDLVNEDSFVIYELAKILVNDLYWREINNSDSKLTEEGVNQLLLTASTLASISDIIANLLMGGQNSIKEANNILNNNNEDEV